MHKNAIKKYAVWARNELIDRVSKKALRYGIASGKKADPKDETVDGKILTAPEQKQRAALIAKIDAHGYEQTIEEAAYTWFNRFVALRFLEVNGYLPSHVRVFTNDAGEFKPQILAEAIHLELPGLDREKVYALKEANDEEALFCYLIIVQCNALNEILPGMFQRLEDFTELLLPDNLLREGSAIHRLVKQGAPDSIPEEDWRDQVQIIGWLYQYYNTEPKRAVFADLKKNIKVTKEKIPAATQLFTPDWIVRYMVENSLGRLWLEGHPSEALQGEWNYYLPEAEQEAAVQKQLAEMRKAYAEMKPEDMRCIDPCMGSGHILCYMFDVLVKIYEAYGYTAREAVASILQNNLYGLDIDDRAAQLAYFAVMMKARQYDRRFFSRAIQPHVQAIQESNGLAPWAKTAGDNLVSGQLTLEDDFIRMVDDLIETFQDAKEYGALLTVQPDRYEALLDVIEKTKREDGDLLLRGWREEVERSIVPLIRQAKMLSMKYDVVVTNPPYMGASNMSAKLSTFVKKHYPDTKSDLFSCCVSQFTKLALPHGYIGFLTPYVWMFISSYEKLRKYMIDEKTIATLIQFEYSAFEEAIVPICTFVLWNTHIDKKSPYLRLTEYRGGMEVQRQKALEAISTHHKDMYFEAYARNFEKIPGMPIAYWVSQAIILAFENSSIKDIGATKQGVATGDNGRFLRIWSEVSMKNIGFNIENREVSICSQRKWFPCNKGGNYRKWFGNNDYVVNWFNDGEELRNFTDEKGKLRSRPQNMDYYFRDGITWSTLSAGQLSMRYSPRGHLFETKGSVCFFEQDKDKYYVLALMNTKVVYEILKVLTPTVDFHEGPIGRTPVIYDDKKAAKIIEVAQENISTSRTDWDAFETSWDFARHPIVQKALSRSHRGDEVASTIEDVYRFVAQDFEERFTKLKANEEELNRIFINLYGLTAELTPEVADKDVTVARIFDSKEDIPEAMKGSSYALTKADVVKSLISYAVGCMFGRYSLDAPGLIYAGGEWDASKYTTFLPDEDAIIPICDDAYFDEDIVSRFVAFIATVFGRETMEENLQFIAAALGGRGSSREIIRSYFLTGFYADHVKTYQKRPIYWLFDSGKKNGFKCLVYLHRYRPDTLARMRTDYVHEQQSRYHTAMESLAHDREQAATAAERVKLGKRRSAIEAQAKELREYEEKLHHLADQMIAIDLDDGVKHNYAIFQDVLAKMK